MLTSRKLTESEDLCDIYFFFQVFYLKFQNLTYQFCNFNKRNNLFRCKAAHILASPNKLLFYILIFQSPYYSTDVAIYRNFKDKLKAFLLVQYLPTFSGELNRVARDPKMYYILQGADFCFFCRAGGKISSALITCLQCDSILHKSAMSSDDFKRLQSYRLPASYSRQDLLGISEHMRD